MTLKGDSSRKSLVRPTRAVSTRNPTRDSEEPDLNHNNRRIAMENLATPLKTKAYYKQQWQDHLDTTSQRSGTSKTKSRSKKHRRSARKETAAKLATMRPCYVRLEQMTRKPKQRPVAAVQPMQAPSIGPAQPPGVPPTPSTVPTVNPEVIELSDEEVNHTTASEMGLLKPTNAFSGSVAAPRSDRHRRRLDG
ncbi:uncharacterized protein [Musca autumnalis]|uniref:uncharacterized protein n=1 Tax=Musca autumnalis TaxID=221902 RepID=UPI003CF364DD